MFIAHLPAGYLLTKAGTKLSNTHNKAIIFWTCLGSILPDIDIIYFYLIDNQSSHHRLYVTHWPLVWIGLIVASLIVMGVNRKLGLITLCLGIGSLLHMLLDSVAAPVLWLAPFSQAQLELITIPARFDNYIWSFVLHWTFALEIIICSVATVMFLRSRASKLQKHNAKDRKQ